VPENFQTVSEGEFSEVRPTSTPPGRWSVRDSVLSRGPGVLGRMTEVRELRFSEGCSHLRTRSVHSAISCGSSKTIPDYGLNSSRTHHGLLRYIKKGH
jgi:hypothetical protein